MQERERKREGPRWDRRQTIDNEGEGERAGRERGIQRREENLRVVLGEHVETLTFLRGREFEERQQQ